MLSDLTIYGAEIGETTLPLQLEGTLKKPWIDLTAALQALFSEQSASIIKAIGLKELNIDSSAKPGDMLIQGLTNRVDEISGSPELQNLIRQVVPGSQTPNGAATNQSSIKETLGNVLFEQLEKNVNEVDKTSSDNLKGLFNNLLKK